MNQKQVTIDRNGQVRFVHHGHDPSDIPSNEEILMSLRAMNDSKGHVSGFVLDARNEDEIDQ